MKKRLALFLFVLLLAACGNEIEETEVTASETTSLEEQVDTEIASEASEVETEEPAPVESTEVEEVEEVEVAEEPVVVEEEPVEEPEEAIYTPKSGTITAEEIKALVPEYFGIDEIAALEVNGGDIYVSVNMATGDLFTPADIAVATYIQLSDELLFYEGWNSLRVEFIGIGTIDMHISEAESNEYGDYFPTLAVEENLYY